LEIFRRSREPPTDMRTICLSVKGCAISTGSLDGPSAAWGDDAHAAIQCVLEPAGFPDIEPLAKAGWQIAASSMAAQEKLYFIKCDHIFWSGEVNGARDTYISEV
jgi:hypothetical protein